jgi:hypothetical protein
LNGLRVKISMNRLALRFAIAIISAVALILVIASPIALKWIAGIHGVDWSNLSDIGQTYGAISALLSALALGTVAVSLLFQARDYRASREQTNRSIHNQLLQMEMEDPFYMEIMGIPMGKSIGLSGYDSMRRSHFILMWLQFWEGLYVLGDMTEGEVRDAATRELFASPYGRQHWSGVRNIRLKFSAGRRLRFAKIIDEEYQKMIEYGFQGEPSTADSGVDHPQANRAQTTRMESGLLICVASGAAILAGHMLRRRLRNMQ